MNRKLTLLGFGLSMTVGAALSSCGGMWLDSGGMGVSIYDGNGPYWQPAPPPPPSYGPVFGPTLGWDAPTYFPGTPAPPPVVNKPSPPKPGIGGGGVTVNPGVNPGRPSNPRPEGGNLPSNPNLNRPNLPAQSSGGNFGGGQPQQTRPQSGASGRH